MSAPEIKKLQLENANLKLSLRNRELAASSKALAQKLDEMAETLENLALRNANLTAARDNALRANDAQNSFIARISYEIRTPMTGILGMIDFTLDSELKPEQASQLKIARRAGKELVRVLNEVIEFSRAEGGGSVTPAAIWPEPAATADSRAMPAATPAGALTVLVAEDDLVIMELMTRLISRAGHRVVPACDGQEALGIWESERPDLLLMDVKMPNLDGIEATRQIRERERETGGAVPIYGITAHVLDEDVARCLQAGMNGHLGKPIDFPDVLAILDRHCSTKAIASSILAASGGTCHGTAWENSSE